MDKNPLVNHTLHEFFSVSKGPVNRSKHIAADNRAHLGGTGTLCRVDALVIGIGDEGSADVTLNLKQHTLQRDLLFIFMPQHTVQAESDKEFQAHVAVISEEFLAHANIDACRSMPLFMQFAATPCLMLTPDEAEVLRSFIALLASEPLNDEDWCSQEVISSLISATIYKVGEIVHRHFGIQPPEGSVTQSRAEEYFWQFMNLLAEHYNCERSVGFYAQKMCITPKYLTTLIKRISGKSVSEWIDTYVITEAKTLLRYTNLSVQEVAYSLNFTNQSFFGSYFKRIIGVSPSQYKAENRNNRSASLQPEYGRNKSAATTGDAGM